ncbi:MAG: YggS family pyridoxal phosphate-dependent enzyme [Bacteroidetes bacterium]|uniref:Pyridoxal phosphate homeostasis protein n=2 Tax=Candidatus Cryptobacteroides TaxID=2840523 RepID=A0A9D9EEJ5_9BACT|nr:YggS family pyridoxal phosphate-dependent enzyme [Candidatus Cryptobacteroides merdavium]
MSHIADTIHRLHEELPENVKLVAVSKFHPAEAVAEAYAAGQRVFGESRPQELSAKIVALREMAASSDAPEMYSDIEWHFIGHLQTNKLKLVLPYVAMVESVDSLRLLSAVDGWGAANGKVTDVLLEYHIASEETKQGFSREEILDIVSGQGFRNVRIRGLMGMATFTDDEEVIRADFARLMSLYDEIVRLRDAGLCPGAGPDFDVRSFGMTHDYRIAVAMGADVVRIGTLIFGERV